MPDGVENSSLQTVTIERTGEDSLAEVAIDRRSELDEEKNESEIMNINFETFCHQQIYHDRKQNYSHIRETYFSRKRKGNFYIRYRISFSFSSRGNYIGINTNY